MVTVPVAPRPQKHLSLKVGADEYAAHVSNVTLTPSTSALEWRGGTPDAVFTDQSAPTWSAAITAIQDFETEDSFVNFCLDHVGEQVEMTYKPNESGDFGITSTITIAAPTIGGPVNAYNESTMTMGATKPERIAVAP